uniref:Glutathione transferase n=1 Tax=Amphora coffeiformis TaxID=265554 RepID=A0A7S3P5J2_9STRA|mmetsp:Transcript_11495/g.21999  ORF Transcript_11495/g.21999 Transcript_11495/m.21999 type:complete len:234 (+) Transcript_11495:113-814(+)|eukprot:scaffold6781_cov204-Amphora_coffeaeformis.AAC.25
MPATTYTLYAPEASFRAFATLIAAEYNGLEVEVSTDTAAAAKSPVGKLPLLEIQGNNNNPITIFSSHAMARYMANVRRDTGLTGQTCVETAQVDAWMDFAAQELELPACIWFYPVAGYMPFHADAYEKAKKDLAKGLAHLETHLQRSSSSSSSSADAADGYYYYYLVGSQITLADIVVASTLLYPFKLVADPKYLQPFPTVVQWFQQCMGHAEFQQVVGHVVMCQTELKAPPS